MANEHEYKALYNQVVAELNKVFAEAAAEWPKAPAPTTLETEDEKRKRWEKQYELARDSSAGAFGAVYSAIEKIVKKQDPEFSLEKIPNEKYNQLTQIILKTINKWGDYQKRKHTADNPLPELKKVNFTTGIQGFFNELAKFFRSITGQKKAADFFEEAARFAVKEAGRTIAQAGELAALANKGKYRAPAASKEKEARYRD